ncbi:MAG: RNA pseudouridine synthase [Candidatus Omnitrophota bacterium]
MVYEDDWLLIVNKPAGLLTIPTPKNETYTLTNILNQGLKEKGLSFLLHPCHRLDKDTSGLIIYAKGKSAQKKVIELFRLKKIKKTYIAFIQGGLGKAQGEITLPIEGVSAVTKYKVLGTGRQKDWTIVEINPLTGRTNQIRIHFKSIGHPIIGEKKFAYRRDFKLTANRLCLHARRLEFPHPVSGGLIKADSELPLGMEHFLERFS